jgi:hypothetical protein
MRAVLRAFAAAAGLACAACHTVGAQTTTGAVESVRQMKATTPEEEQITFLVGQRVMQGAMQQLESPKTKALIGAIADDAASQALTRIHGELDLGEGRLARDLDATAARVSIAVMRAVDGELDALLGECDGLDRRACLRREVRALGKEASMGAFDAIVGSHLWIAGLAVFLAGVAAALLGRVAWDHVGHGSRPAGRAARA